MTFPFIPSLCAFGFPSLAPLPSSAMQIAYSLQSIPPPSSPFPATSSHIPSLYPIAFNTAASFYLPFTSSRAISFLTPCCSLHVISHHISSCHITFYHVTSHHSHFTPFHPIPSHPIPFHPVPSLSEWRALIAIFLLESKRSVGLSDIGSR